MAKIYIVLFLIFNIMLLLVGLFFAMSAVASPNYGYGGMFLVYLVSSWGIIQPLIGIPVSIYYLKKRAWARTGMKVTLSIILAFWTLLSLYVVFSFADSFAFIIGWFVAAAVVLTGILLVHKDCFSSECARNE
ncbi:MAG: hypothetical protein GY854_03150 [Deltaproteobacteria bacterium]|nr:hypothetical protein [Deltaproteobacteria bacterium]